MKSKKGKAKRTDSELPRDVSGLPKGFIGLRGWMQVSAELQWTQQRGYAGSFAAVSVVPFAAVSVGDNSLCINALANYLWVKFTIEKSLIH